MPRRKKTRAPEPPAWLNLAYNFDSHIFGGKEAGMREAYQARIDAIAAQVLGNAAPA